MKKGRINEKNGDYMHFLYLCIIYGIYGIYVLFMYYLWIKYKRIVITYFHHIFQQNFCAMQQNM